MNVDKMRHQLRRDHVSPDRRGAALIVAFIRKHLLVEGVALQPWQERFILQLPQTPPLRLRPFLR
jgi:hypothetical protein